MQTERVVVPSIVANEVRRYGDTDPAAKALVGTPWIEIVESAPASPEIQAWDLGPGESAVLTWAHKRANTVAVLDDLPARRCAATLGIPVRGTLGVILIAKKHRRIESARATLEALRRSGLYLSDPIVDAALRLVGE